MDITKFCSVLLIYMFCNGVSCLSDEKRLVKHLLENYERIGIVGRPVYNTSETVYVQFGISVIKLVDFNIMDNTGTFSIWQRHTWKDLFLAWNPDDFGGVNHVRIPAHKIWGPDIVLYNSLGPDTFKIGKAMAVVSNDGSVMWIPPATVKVTCDSDGNFPFDKQICYFKFASWTYDGFKLDVDFYGFKGVDLSDYIGNNDWYLTETSARKNVKYYPCCDEPFPDLSFQLGFHRHSGPIKFVVTLSTAVLFLLILLIFWLHPGSVSKFVIGGFVLLAFLLLMVTIAHAFRAAKLLLWLGLGFVLAFTAMLTSVITSAVAKKGNTGRALPHCLNMVCGKVFGMILCSDRPLDGKTGQSADNNADAKPNQEMLKQQWVAFAQVLDRIAFILHALVLIIMAGEHA